MARLSSEVKHCLIGAAACLGIALFFTTAYSGNPDKLDKDGYHLYAVFDSADGVTAGSEVLLAGLPIGRVRTLVLDKETNQAIVQMTIDDGIGIPIDSEASIISDGIGGGKYIRVAAGGDLDVLKPDEHFDYTRGTVQFFELFEKIILMGEAKQKPEAS